MRRLAGSTKDLDWGSSTTMTSPARRAGFELAVAHDLFVHHFGSRTFAGNGIDAGKLMDETPGDSRPSRGCVGPSGGRVYYGRGRRIRSITRT